MSQSEYPSFSPFCICSIVWGLYEGGIRVGLGRANSDRDAREALVREITMELKNRTTCDGFVRGRKWCGRIIHDNFVACHAAGFIG
jgi:hypothetical protein